MANKEACELFIEQQIEEGLKDGKTPYSLGKEISDWIAKFLEVKIKPNTLRMRAERQKEKLCTNVHKKTESDSFGIPGVRGPKQTKNQERYVMPSFSIQYAHFAISQLERITNDDPKAIEALEIVEEWIINKKKQLIKED